MRKFSAVLCLLAAAFFLVPLALEVCHLGMFAPAAALLFLAAFLLWGEKWPRWLRRGVTALYLCGGAVVLGLLWQMGVCTRNVPAADSGERTVVVLGCRAFHGRPGLMLQGRIDAAYAYLEDHPESYCVCSGGLDEMKEPLTQGEVIAKTLAEMGIERRRLLVDSRSENTRENLAFSAELIRENGLTPQVAIASDNFHELRAAEYAKDVGLVPCALGCRSPWYLAPGYYCREMMALAAHWLLGW